MVITRAEFLRCFSIFPYLAEYVPISLVVSNLPPHLGGFQPEISKFWGPDSNWPTWRLGVQEIGAICNSKYFWGFLPWCPFKAILSSNLQLVGFSLGIPGALPRCIQPLITSIRPCSTAKMWPQEMALAIWFCLSIGYPNSNALGFSPHRLLFCGITYLSTNLSIALFIKYIPLISIIESPITFPFISLLYVSPFIFY